MRTPNIDRGAPSAHVCNHFLKGTLAAQLDLSTFFLFSGYMLFFGVSMLEKQCLQCLLVQLMLFSLATGFPTQHQTHPSTVKVGALLSLNSTIGKISKIALEFAVEKINQERKLLHGTKILLKVADYNCNTFQGVTAAIKLFEEEVVAIVGPQTSSVARLVAKVAEAVRVPLVAFSATDPSLSGTRYSYFTRVVFNDDMQMNAVASIISNYGWKEAVVLFTEDNFGRNAINFLRDALEAHGCKVINKVVFHPNLDMTELHNNLIRLQHMKSKVFVVHMEPKFVRILLSVAQNLSMFNAGHAWIITDNIARTLDAEYFDVGLWKVTYGIIGARSYMPMSSKVKAVQSELRRKVGNKHAADQLVNVYGFYAYDAIWTVAKALHNFLGQQKNVSFMHSSLHAEAGGRFRIAKLKVFENGHFLLNEILNIKFSGATGLVKLDMRGERVGTVFEVVSVVGKKLHVVGHWTNESGCCTFLSDANAKRIIPKVSQLTAGSQNVRDAIWSRGSFINPHSWAFKKYVRPLQVAFPKDAIERGLVSTTVDGNNVTNFHGFFIDVFEAAIAYLPYNVGYIFIPLANGSSAYNLDNLLQRVADKEFDAAIGDIAITPSRLQIVDFTQPYVAAGLVFVVCEKNNSSPKVWSFLKPFTPAMWFTMLAFIFFTGLVVWMLEHRKNKQFQGKLKKQVATALWFIFSTLFFAQSEKVKSILGRIVVIVWLFVVLIVNSSYIANLTLLLTADHLKPEFQEISEVLASGVPIGYPDGSYVADFLNKLGVARDRLVPLQDVSSYAEILSKGPKGGGVGAIVDEQPHIQLFFSLQCDYKIYSRQFTSNGWGFAFQKGSRLAVDVSIAIVGLEEKGELQRIHDKWFGSMTACQPADSVDSSQLGLPSSWALFLVTGCVSLISLILYLLRRSPSFICRRVKQR